MPVIKRIDSTNHVNILNIFYNSSWNLEFNDFDVIYDFFYAILSQRVEYP